MIEPYLTIDLGSQNTVVACSTKEGVQILLSSTSSRKNPTCVTYTQDGRMFGQVAQQQANANMKSYIENIKYFIETGEPLNPAKTLNVVNDPKHTLEYNKDAKAVELTMDKDEKHKTEFFYLQQIVAYVIKANADYYKFHYKIEPKQVAFVVPPHWSNVQRNILIDAGMLAKIPVKYIFNSSAAQAMDYVCRFSNADLEQGLFVDVGASESLASVIGFKKQDDKLAIKLKAYGHTSKLSGNFMTKKLLEVAAPEYINSEDYQQYTALFAAGEEAKKTLSCNNTAYFKATVSSSEMIDKPVDRRSLNKRITGALDEFSDMVTNVINVCDSFEVAEAHGGTCRYPPVTECVKNAASSSNITQRLNAEECIAEGGAYLFKEVSEERCVIDPSAVWNVRAVPVNKKGKEDEDGTILFNLIGHKSHPVTMNLPKGTYNFYQVTPSYIPLEDEEGNEEEDNEGIDEDDGLEYPEIDEEEEDGDSVTKERIPYKALIGTLALKEEKKVTVSIDADFGLIKVEENDFKDCTRITEKDTEKIMAVESEIEKIEKDILEAHTAINDLQAHYYGWLRMRFAPDLKDAVEKKYKEIDDWVQNDKNYRYASEIYRHALKYTSLTPIFKYITNKIDLFQKYNNYIIDDQNGIERPPTYQEWLCDFSNVGNDDIVLRLKRMDQEYSEHNKKLEKHAFVVYQQRLIVHFKRSIEKTMQNFRSTIPMFTKQVSLYTLNNPLKVVRIRQIAIATGKPRDDAVDLLDRIDGTISTSQQVNNRLFMIKNRLAAIPGKVDEQEKYMKGKPRTQKQFQAIQEERPPEEKEEKHRHCHKGGEEEPKKEKSDKEKRREEKERKKEEERRKKEEEKERKKEEERRKKEEKEQKKAAKSKK